MKRVLFLLHGIGRHDKGWSDEVVEVLKDKAAELETDTALGFSAPRFQAELAEAEFVELLYDDLYQKFVERMLQREEDFIKALKTAGFGALGKIFTTDASQKDFIRDNIFDIVIYYAMKEHRYATRKWLAAQVYARLIEHGIVDVEYSLMAHSLGTVVAHDLLQEMATESGSPWRWGSAFKFKNLFMVSNTSALLRNDYPPRRSLVRPWLSWEVGKPPGYIYRYFDFAHKFDPVCQLFSYQKYVDAEKTSRDVFVTVKHFQSPNIHGYTHYLSHPSVHMAVLNAVFGDGLLPPAYVKSVIEAAPADSPGAADLVKKLEKILQDGQDGDVPKLVVLILEGLKEMLP
jgi:hypothetical protein